MDRHTCVDMVEARILVIEDDLGIASNLVAALEAHGYATQLAHDGRSALALAAENRPDLVLLDLGLPDVDGVDVCRSMTEQHPGIRIVVLTARDEEIDVVIGLDAGAADYVTKPFRLAELLARVRAQVRRQQDAPTVLTVGTITVDRAARRVWVGDDEVSLRNLEMGLLVTLANHAGSVVTREQLMAEVWDEHWFGSTKRLDVHMAALRRKLGEAPGAPSQITTLRGVGYRLELESPAR